MPENPAEISTRVRSKTNGTSGTNGLECPEPGRNMATKSPNQWDIRGNGGDQYARTESARTNHK
ncbi:hypothetical protein KI387_014889, partial [Taxus chinensis]